MTQKIQDEKTRQALKTFTVQLTSSSTREMEQAFPLLRAAVEADNYIKATDILRDITACLSNVCSSLGFASDGLGIPCDENEGENADDDGPVKSTSSYKYSSIMAEMFDKQLRKLR